MQRLHIPNEQRKRLDVVFADMFALSRTQAQKKLSGIHILVNGKDASAHTLVSVQDAVHIVSERAIPNVHHTKPTTLLPQPLRILYEDPDVLVVVKPAGLVMHKTQTTDTQPTLVDFACAHAPEIAHIGENPLRPGVVHRLDRLASGVVIFAKTPAAFFHLKKQFQTRQTIKKYTVLVSGTLADDHGTITFPIARSRARGRMAARPHSQSGKDAVTHFQVIGRYTSSTLLDVHIETGRTHQIRAHFFAIEHPVIGDDVYVNKKTKVRKGKGALSRLFLHARELSLTLPNGEFHTFTAELPPELAQYLQTLLVAYDTHHPLSPSRQVAH